jgi:hypothetical protein
MTNSEKLHASTRDTLTHIAKVEGYLALCADWLRQRAAIHDASKLQEPELSGYAGLSDALNGLAYGTPEHSAAFRPFKEIIQHHYQHNRHHPEYHPNGINDMTLLDVLEMLCDWKAASERSHGDFMESIRISSERFNIDSQLSLILVNTARDFGWIEHK